MNKPSSKKSSMIGMFFGILAVSTASLIIRYAQQGVSSLVIAAGRMSLAALILVPFSFRRWQTEIRCLPRRSLLLMGLAGVFLGLHFATWITSLEYTSVASSVVLVTTAPLWVAILSPFFLRERIGFGTLLGLLISLSGSVIVSLNSTCIITNGTFQCIGLSSMFTGQAFWGNLLALAGAFLSAGYLMVGRKVREELSLLVYTSVVYGIAALVLLVLVMIKGEDIGAISPQYWGWILLLAIIPQIIGHSIFNYFLKKLSATFVSIALLGEPIGSVLLVFLFMGETPSILEIAGGILILAGIGIATSANKKLSNHNELIEELSN